MKQVNTMTATDQLKVSSYGIELVRVTGELATGSDAFLQIHENDGVASTNVPKLSRRIYNGDRFELDLEEGLALSKCILGISSTEGTFTSAGNVATMTAIFKSKINPPEGTIFGSQTVEDETLEIEADATGAILYEVTFNNTTATDYRVCICGVAEADILGAKPLYISTVMAGTSLTMSWGKDGVRIVSAITATFSDNSAYGEAAPPGVTTGMYIYGVATAL